MATLILKRLRKYADKARAYKIYLDGKKIGKIKEGETKTFEITTGKHQIYAKIDTLKSNTVDFEVKNDAQTIKMTIQNNTSIWAIGLLAGLGGFLASFLLNWFIRDHKILSFLIFFFFIFAIMKLYFTFKPYILIKVVED